MSLCREMSLLARHLYKTFNTFYKTSTVQRCSKVDVDDWHIPVWASFSHASLFIARSLNLRLMACVVSPSPLEVIQRGAWVTANFYIPSRLDYCNYIVIGTPNSAIRRHPEIFNFAATLVLLAPRHHHLTLLLEKLQWLLIWKRIQYKVACMCLNGTKDFWSCLPLWTATCLHSVSYTTICFWHPHAENPAIQTQDSTAFAPSLALDPTFGIHSHKTLDTAQL